MVYTGHIINGQVVLDRPTDLPEGAPVWVHVQTEHISANGEMSLRGTPYEFDEPFAPAVAPEEWEAQT